MLNWIVWNRTICINMDLVLNNLQQLICHKTQPTNRDHSPKKYTAFRIGSNWWGKIDYYWLLRFINSFDCNIFVLLFQYFSAWTWKQDGNWSTSYCTWSNTYVTTGKKFFSVLILKSSPIKVSLKNKWYLLKLLGQVKNLAIFWYISVGHIYHMTEAISTCSNW